MKSCKLLALAAIPFILGAAAPRSDDACKLAYRTRIQPIFNTNCVACHQDASPAGKLSLQRTSAPASLLGVASSEAKMSRVTPGKPQQSYLFRKLTGTHRAAGGNGEKMPLGGQLSAANIATVSEWISSCKGL